MGIEGRSAPRQIIENCCAARPGFPQNLLNVAPAELIPWPSRSSTETRFRLFAEWLLQRAQGRAEAKLGPEHILPKALFETAGYRLTLGV